MCACVLCVYLVVTRPGERTVASSELEVQVVVGYHMDFRNASWVLYKGIQATTVFGF